LFINGGTNKIQNLPHKHGYPAGRMRINLKVERMRRYNTMEEKTKDRYVAVRLHADIF
jgi:hypothetical protein